MNAPAAAARFSTLHQNNRVLRFAVVVLLLMVLGLAFGLVFRTQIITIVPSNAMVKSTYTATSADESALTSWGLSLATLLGNVTPSNADFVSESIGHMLAPGIYKEVMDGIASQVMKIKTNQLTLKFDPADIKFDQRKTLVFVNGWLTTTDSHGTEQREERTYELYFKVVNYQPVVVGLTSYVGKPHFGQ